MGTRLVQGDVGAEVWGMVGGRVAILSVRPLREDERDSWTPGLGRCLGSVWVVAAKGGSEGIRT